MKALIIAAGEGSRLRQGLTERPKPLWKVAGVPLLERIIRTSKKAGITEFVIVVGFNKELIIAALNPEVLGVKLTFVENKDWKKSNGVSVLAAKDYIKEDFVLLMSDHIFDHKTLEKLKNFNKRESKLVLAVDRKLSTIFDMDDATKVKLDGDKIIEIGKTIPSYDAVDTGMFLLSPEFFNILEEAKIKKNGDCSLSDGVKHLADRGLASTFDIGNAYWQDADTPETLKHAEKLLLNSCRKPTDGIISRNFNRYVSLGITKWLIKTPLTANQMTGVTSIVGIMSGVLTGMGHYWSIVLGAILFKLSSILDGCDGEMSKLKFTESKKGQWLDTISDNFTYICYIVGVIVGLDRLGYLHVKVAGSLAIFGLLMTLLLMFTYLIRHTDSGSLLAVNSDFQKLEESLLKKLVNKVSFMTKRDFFALLFLVLALFNRLHIVLWLAALATNIMWIVLVVTRMGNSKSVIVTKESDQTIR